MDSRYQLTSDRSRVEIVKRCEKEVPELSWREMIEEASVNVLRRFRRGAEVVDLSTWTPSKSSRGGYRLTPLLAEGQAMSVAGVSQPVAPCCRMRERDRCRRFVASCRAVLQTDCRDKCRRTVASCRGGIAVQRLRQQHTLKGVCAAVAGEVVDGRCFRKSWLPCASSVQGQGWSVNGRVAN